MWCDNSSEVIKEKHTHYDIWPFLENNNDWHHGINTKIGSGYFTKILRLQFEKKKGELLMTEWKVSWEKSILRYTGNEHEK